jgi:hypothetical protein
MRMSKLFLVEEWNMCKIRLGVMQRRNWRETENNKRNMKKIARLCGVLAGGGALLSGVAQAATVNSLNFSGLPTSAVQFDGHTFDFTGVIPALQGRYGANEIHVTSESGFGGSSSSVGDLGFFSIGASSGAATTWSFGAITVYGNGVQIANVTSPANTEVTLGDGFGGTLTANLAWMTVQTSAQIGSLNGSLTLNLSDVTYTPGTSSNPDFVTLATGVTPSLIVSFSVPGNPSLTQLATGGLHQSTSYSGSISETVTPPPPPPIPEATTTVAGGAALCSVVLLMATQRRQNGALKISK